MSELSKEKHPIDIEGMNYKHNKYFWWPYGYNCETLPDELRGTAVCSEMPFFRIEEIDYQQLLKDCISKSIRLYGTPIAGYCVNFGFKYLGLNWDDWETLEGDNEFFRKLFWSVYLHVNNYAYRTRHDELFELEDANFGHINEVFCSILEKNDLAEPNAWYFNDVDYLPCILEKYEIYPADSNK